MRKVILLFILITSVLGAWADGNVTFTASAPDVVVSGDQFRLTYTVNTHKVRDFRAPNIKGFDVLMGPSRSQQSSTQIINGNVTSTSSITFTYILMADKEGTYTIPGATIVADGQNKTSNSVQIKVLPPDQTNLDWLFCFRQPDCVKKFFHRYCFHLQHHLFDQAVIL